MAITLAVVGTSAHAIRYSILGDTLDEISSRAVATVLAELGEGPLKAYLERQDISGDAAWTALGKADFAVQVLSGAATGLTTGATANAVASFEALTPGTRTLNFKISKVGVLPCIVEVRFIRSPDQ